LLSLVLLVVPRHAGLDLLQDSHGVAIKTATRRPPLGGTVSGPSRRVHQPSSCLAIQGMETSASEAATA
jgi:hypothetical protein